MFKRNLGTMIIEEEEVNIRLRVSQTRAKVARLLRTEGLNTSDLMEATALRSASPRRTDRSTLAASLLAKRADLSAPEKRCLVAGGVFVL